MCLIYIEETVDLLFCGFEPECKNESTEIFIIITTTLRGAYKY